MITRKEQQEIKNISKVNITDKRVLIEIIETVTIRHYTREDDVVEEEEELFKTEIYKKKHKYEHTFSPHIDFLNSLKMLRKLAIDLCEFRDFENFERYQVIGVTFSGMDSDDEAGVIISCIKTTERTNEKFEFDTPFNLLNDPNYADTDKLDNYCAVIRDESYQYLSGKHAENPQLSLQFESGESVQMKIVDNEKVTVQDQLFEEAARLIVTHQQGSTSLIQRKLKVGYNRAIRIMNQLQKAGVVGEPKSDDASVKTVVEVLIKNEIDLEQLLNNLKNNEN